MKKLFLALALSAVSFSAVVAQNGMKSEDSELLASRRKSGNRTFGVGLNYTFPASGLSARFGINDNLKGQVSFGFRNYSDIETTARLISIGAEIDYAFEEKKGGLGYWFPFAYGSLGQSTYTSEYTGTPIPGYNMDAFDYKFSWVGWSVGGGIELFPEFLGGDVGVNWKLGLGSLGSFGLNYGTTTGLIYGGGIHYYIK
jgi:hypothetical protein